MFEHKPVRMGIPSRGQIGSLSCIDSVYVDSDLNVRLYPSKTACGCDDSKELIAKCETLMSEGMKARAEKDRLMSDLVDCERRLAKMTQERDDLLAARAPKR